jgi:uncharacterized protein YcbK (DUF882 family)
VVTQIDPRLFDIVAEFHRTLRLREPLQVVVSPYRTPETNSQHAFERRRREQFHIRGMAVDIMTRSRSSAEMTRAARALHIGVGNYGGARLIHVDSGRFRSSQ